MTAPAGDENILEQADVFLAQATGCESFGIVVLDALAAGLPVVASNIPAYRDLLEQGDSGVLVPPGDAEALADGIARVLHDHDLWRILSPQALRAAAHLLGIMLRHVLKPSIVRRSGPWGPRSHRRSVSNIDGSPHWIA